MASRAAFPATPGAPVMNPVMNSPGHPRMAAMNPAYRAMPNPVNQYPVNSRVIDLLSFIFRDNFQFSVYFFNLVLLFRK